jgi:hypothetical protein
LNECEARPGVPPAHPALEPAQIIDIIDKMLVAYYGRGGTPETVLLVEGNHDEEYLKKLQGIWKQWLYQIRNGIKRVYEVLALRSGVTPQTIGSNVNDMGIDGVVSQRREDIAIAFGVPMSKLLSDAANRDIRLMDEVSFIMDTLMPECTLIADQWNRQLFNDLGLMLEFDPWKLPAMQRFFVERVKAVTEVVGIPVMTVAEGRELLGLEDKTNDDLIEPQEPEPPESEPETEIDTDDQTEDMVKELSQWRRFALRRFGNAAKMAAFETSATPEDLSHAIQHALTHCETSEHVKTVFELAEQQLKQVEDEDVVEPERDVFERQMQRAVQGVFNEWEPIAEQAIDEGRDLDYTALRAALIAALIPTLTNAARNRADEIQDEFQLFAPDAVLDSDVEAWAREYAAEQADLLVGTTRKLYGQARDATSDTDREQILGRAFGRVRSEAISITSITDALSAGLILLNAIYERENGVTVDEVWFTRLDERVCPICGPLHGKPKRVWAEQFPDGPPAHPRCRCFTRVLRLRRIK